jgi:putative oxidoreductase
MNGLGLFVLRLALAAVFIAHGAHTIFGVWSTPGIGPGGLIATGEFYTALGVPGGAWIALLAGVTQFCAGVLIGLGWFTRGAIVALLIYLAAGFWKVHMHWGFFLNWQGVAGRREGMEYSILVAGALVCLLIAGAGEWSFDGRRESRSARAAAGRARLRGRF